MNNAQLVIDEVKKAVKGKDDCIIKAFAAFLAGGHILLEDVPGVGKTTLAVAFSRAMALVNHRVQFTPDVLPADILGFSMYQKQTGEFVYREGAVMCNLFLADEINRTSPKTQSALLEVMEEGNVTVDGISRKVPEPFIVMATQNPKGSAGTQLLPESQLDRFMICMSMGYPSHDAEVDIAKGKSVKADEYTIKPVMNAQGLVEMQGEVEQVFIHDSIYSYIVDLVDDRIDRNSGLTGLTVTDDQLTLTSSDGNHGVDCLDTCLERRVYALTSDNTTCHTLNLAEFIGLYGALAIDGLS